MSEDIATSTKRELMVLFHFMNAYGDLEYRQAHNLVTSVASKYFPGMRMGEGSFKLATDNLEIKGYISIYEDKDQTYISGEGKGWKIYNSERDKDEWKKRLGNIDELLK